MPWFASPGFQKIRYNSLLTEESLHFLSRNEVLGRRLELQKRTYAGVQSVSVDQFDSRSRAQGPVESSSVLPRWWLEP